MALHNKIQFENDICEHLSVNGWHYAAPDVEADTTGYDTPGRSFRPTCRAIQALILGTAGPVTDKKIQKWPENEQNVSQLKIFPPLHADRP
jgi:hypothetical protein